MQDGAVLVDEAGADHAGRLVGVGGVLQLGQPRGVDHVDVVVHEDDVLVGPAGGDADVAALGEAQVGGVLEQGQPVLLAEPLDGAVGAAVVDDDQPPGGVVGALLQGGQAPLGEGEGVPGEDDDGDRRPRWLLRSAAPLRSLTRRPGRRGSGTRPRSAAARSQPQPLERSSRLWLKRVCCSMIGATYQRRPRLTRRLANLMAGPITRPVGPRWELDLDVGGAPQQGDPQVVVALGEDVDRPLAVSASRRPVDPAAGPRRPGEGRLHPRHHHVHVGAPRVEGIRRSPVDADAFQWAGTWNMPALHRAGRGGRGRRRSACGR